MKDSLYYVLARAEITENISKINIFHLQQSSRERVDSTIGAAQETNLQSSAGEYYVS